MGSSNRKRMAKEENQDRGEKIEEGHEKVKGESILRKKDKMRKASRGGERSGAFPKPSSVDQKEGGGRERDAGRRDGKE